jgi:hypothetical protein
LYSWILLTCIYNKEKHIIHFLLSAHTYTHIFTRAHLKLLRLVYLSKHLEELRGTDEVKEDIVLFCGLFYNVVSIVPMLLFYVLKKLP